MKYLAPGLGGQWPCLGANKSDHLDFATVVTFFWHLWEWTPPSGKRVRISGHRPRSASCLGDRGRNTWVYAPQAQPGNSSYDPKSPHCLSQDQGSQKLWSSLGWPNQSESPLSSLPSVAIRKLLRRKENGFWFVVRIAKVSIKTPFWAWVIQSHSNDLCRDGDQAGMTTCGLLSTRFWPSHTWDEGGRS